MVWIEREWNAINEKQRREWKKNSTDVRAASDASTNNTNKIITAAATAKHSNLL